MHRRGLLDLLGRTRQADGPASLSTHRRPRAGLGAWLGLVLGLSLLVATLAPAPALGQVAPTPPVLLDMSPAVATPGSSVQ
jgi:hypothetical protein